MSTLPARLAAITLTNEKSRKTLGWVIALILSPIILLEAFLCCFGTAAAEHNSFAVSASFYGAAFSDDIPAEYEEHITEMRKAFSLLDAAVSAVNAEAGETASGRMKEALHALNVDTVRLRPVHKDWNDDLCAQCGKTNGPTA